MGKESPDIPSRFPPGSQARVGTHHASHRFWKLLINLTVVGGSSLDSLPSVKWARGRVRRYSTRMLN